jgi:hypothetical protein
MDSLSLVDSFSSYFGLKFKNTYLSIQNLKMYVQTGLKKPGQTSFAKTRLKTSQKPFCYSTYVHFFPKTQLFGEIGLERKALVKFILEECLKGTAAAFVFFQVHFFGGCPGNMILEDDFVGYCCG